MLSLPVWLQYMYMCVLYVCSIYVEYVQCQLFIGIYAYSGQWVQMFLGFTFCGELSEALRVQQTHSWAQASAHPVPFTTVNCRSWKRAFLTTHLVENKSQGNVRLPWLFFIPHSVSTHAFRWAVNEAESRLSPQTPQGSHYKTHAQSTTFLHDGN